jgi:hypothetical protein
MMMVMIFPAAMAEKGLIDEMAASAAHMSVVLHRTDIHSDISEFKIYRKIFSAARQALRNP